MKFKSIPKVVRNIRTVVRNIPKEIIGITIILIICIIALQITCYNFTKDLGSALREINNTGGFKSVVEDVWEGNPDSLKN